MAKTKKQGIEPQQEIAEITNPAPVESAPVESAPATRVVSEPEVKESAPVESAPNPEADELAKAIARDKAHFAATRATLEAQVKEYNDLMQSGKYDQARALLDKINQNKETCVADAWNIEKNILRGKPDPMIAAIEKLTYTSINVREVKQKEVKDPVMTVEEVSRPINLLKLNEAVKGGIGYDKSWPYMIEKFNFLMTARVIREMYPDGKEGDKQAADVLKTLHSSYAMSQTARSLEMGDKITSKTEVLKALQGIVTAMVGPGKNALTHDVRYLDRVYTKKDRAALKVNCANHRYMREICAEICHRILTGKVYEVGYKGIKSK